ncbi:MAG TPA: hypothetical protein VFA83_18165 [Acidimicrobiales bacterium]|nr:hypothetical protein [Acidimicrobiales bacterium]
MEQVPEADAVEQAQEVLPSDDEPIQLSTSDPEVPEADAVEQAQSLPYDDEEERP